MKNIIWGQVIQKKAKYAHIGVVIFSFITNRGAQGSEQRLLPSHRQEDERKGWDRNREQREKRRAARFPASSAGQTNKSFSLLGEKLGTVAPSSYSFLLLFLPLVNSSSSTRSSSPVNPAGVGVRGHLGAAGNRRTLHTRAAHLTHTYESLKLKCSQTNEHKCSGSALERTGMVVLRACRGHLAHKGQSKHSCWMFTPRLSSLSWAQSLLPLSVAL